MKSKNKSRSASTGSAEKSVSAAGAGKDASNEPAPGLGLTERRRLVRPLPTPEVIEGDYDSDWAEFQALVSDDSPSQPKL